MRHIASWTLWQRRWSLMWWAFGVLAYMALVLAFYPPFRNQAAHLDQTLTMQIPNGARSFISDTQDWFTPIGYLSSQVFYLMMPLLLSILAIGLGSSLIAREEQENTIELLLARPISRNKLIAGKTLAGSLIVIIVAAAGFAATIVMARIVDLPVSTKGLGLATLACLLLAGAFGWLAFMVTTFGRARVASIGLAALIAIGGYIINSLSSTATVLKWPAKFMPFHYYHPSDLLNGHYRWTDFAVFAGIIIVCAGISFAAFRRRDIS